MPRLTVASALAIAIVGMLAVAHVPIRERIARAALARVRMAGRSVKDPVAAVGHILRANLLRPSVSRYQVRALPADPVLPVQRVRVTAD